MRSGRNERASDGKRKHVSSIWLQVASAFRMAGALVVDWEAGVPQGSPFSAARWPKSVAVSVSAAAASTVATVTLADITQHARDDVPWTARNNAPLKKAFQESLSKKAFQGNL